MSDCWVCQQKAEWKQEQINRAREEAKQRSMETGKTMVIVRTSACEYKVFEITEITSSKAIEYISANNSS